ncbi:adhesion G protein-coupled receptor G3-like [Protopterus annectens]|uniref:adhesion G protein-coupled receptor G3-like n=1 Tax=Protopterus annectens TaxID=7888 RepID=UPI001CFB5E95|nr:adhesion G protein-coupled receptor G3-like [Protopterus annectens]
MNTAFLLNVAISPYTREGVTCRFLAVITHYYLLCCFCWMGIEGFQLYLLTIRIYNTYIKHFILKLSLIGWGVPAMVVIVTSLIKSSVYGYTNNSLPQCWIKTQTHRYITISGFFGVIFLFNLIILAVVCYKIFQIKSSAPQNEVQPTRWKEVCTILALSCLLGSTWAVVFILENLREPFTLYFFSTLNSLQGFFIFLWFCAMNCPSKAKETKQEGKVTLSAAVVTISSSQ